MKVTCLFGTRHLLQAALVMKSFLEAVPSSRTFHEVLQFEGHWEGVYFSGLWVNRAVLLAVYQAV
jgi:hypothetical protein